MKRRVKRGRPSPIKASLTNQENKVICQNVNVVLGKAIEDARKNHPSPLKEKFRVDKFIYDIKGGKNNYSIVIPKYSLL